MRPRHDRLPPGPDTARPERPIPRQSATSPDTRHSAHAEPPGNRASGCRPPHGRRSPWKGTPPCHRAGRTNVLSSNVSHPTTTVRRYGRTTKRKWKIGYSIEKSADILVANREPGARSRRLPVGHRAIGLIGSLVNSTKPRVGGNRSARSSREYTRTAAVPISPAARPADGASGRGGGAPREAASYRSWLGG